MWEELFFFFHSKIGQINRQIHCLCDFFFFFRFFIVSCVKLGKLLLRESSFMRNSEFLSPHTSLNNSTELRHKTLYVFVLPLFKWDFNLLHGKIFLFVIVKNSKFFSFQHPQRSTVRQEAREKAGEWNKNRFIFVVHPRLFQSSMQNILENNNNKKIANFAFAYVIDLCLLHPFHYLKDILFYFFGCSQFLAQRMFHFMLFMRVG